MVQDRLYTGPQNRSNDYAIEEKHKHEMHDALSNGTQQCPIYLAFESLVVGTAAELDPNLHVMEPKANPSPLFFWARNWFRFAAACHFLQCRRQSP